MSDWEPGTPPANSPTRRSAGGLRPSRAQVLLRATTLGLVTAGSWLRVTFDEYIPRGTGLAVNGVETTRNEFIEAFAKLHSQKPSFKALREVEAGVACSKTTPQSVAARTNVTTGDSMAVVSACYELVQGEMQLVEFIIETPTPWLNKQT